MDIVPRNQHLIPFEDLGIGDTFSFPECETVFIRVYIAQKSNTKDLHCVKLSDKGSGEVCFIAPNQPVRQRFFVLKEKP